VGVAGAPDNTVRLSRTYQGVDSGGRPRSQLPPTDRPFPVCDLQLLPETAASGCWPHALFQRERMFRFDSAREPAVGVSLQVFDVGSGSEARFFERLHRAIAIFAAHDVIAFCEGFIEGARKPTPTHLHLALRHHRRFLLGSH
jgi:hypothetical protein